MHDARHDPDDEDMTYDLRTLPERERADVAALRQTCDKLADALAYLSAELDKQRVHTNGAVNFLATKQAHADHVHARLFETVRGLANDIAALTKRVDDLTSAAMTDLSRTSHDVAALRVELDGVNRIAVTAQTQGANHERRITALERTTGALTDAAARQADALQVLVLRGEGGA